MNSLMKWARRSIFLPCLFFLAFLIIVEKIRFSASAELIIIDILVLVLVEELTAPVEALVAALFGDSKTASSKEHYFS